MREALATHRPAAAPPSTSLAPVRARLLAGVIDEVVSFLPVIGVGLSRGEVVVPTPVYVGVAVLAFAVWVLGNAIALWLTDGRTLGRKLFGIRVVRADGARMTLGCVLRRELGAYVHGGPIDGLKSLASMNWDELHRSSADMRADTLVVVDER
jgi:uncharacterized RDD family membrane protein YckC